MLDVSVVIITWRMKDWLRALLSSIKLHTRGITFEIIVIDNYSQDGTVEMIRKEFPEVRLIANSENKGVAPARNQALRQTSGRYIVTLDADMVLMENSLKQMIEFMDKVPDAGICGCKLISLDGKVQPSARRYPTPVALLTRRLDFLPMIRNSKTLRNHEMIEWDRKDIRTVDYVIGACQFIRREAMDQVGLLDEKIFYGPEDIDYCLRMYKNGWKVYYFPSTSIVHYEQRMTRKNVFSKLTWLHLKGVFYLFFKYRGKISYN